MSQFLSRWMTIGQAERLLYRANMIVVGAVFVFLITLTILAK